MPQAFEVATLWMREVESRHLDPAFRTSGSWVWTAEKGTNSVIAPYFNFNTGTEQWFCRECSSPFLRAVAVRARK
jgi:rubredoxin